MAPSNPPPTFWGYTTSHANQIAQIVFDQPSTCSTDNRYSDQINDIPQEGQLLALLGRSWNHLLFAFLSCFAPGHRSNHFPMRSRGKGGESKLPLNPLNMAKGAMPATWGYSVPGADQRRELAWNTEIGLIGGDFLRGPMASSLVDFKSQVFRLWDHLEVRG